MCVINSYLSQLIRQLLRREKDAGSSAKRRKIRLDDDEDETGQMAVVSYKNIKKRQRIREITANGNGSVSSFGQGKAGGWYTVGVEGKEEATSHLLWMDPGERRGELGNQNWQRDHGALAFEINMLSSNKRPSQKCFSFLPIYESYW